MIPLDALARLKPPPPLSGTLGVPRDQSARESSVVRCSHFIILNVRITFSQTEPGFQFGINRPSSYYRSSLSNKLLDGLSIEMSPVRTSPWLSIAHMGYHNTIELVTNCFRKQRRFWQLWLRLCCVQQPLHPSMTTLCAALISLVLSAAPTCLDPSFLRLDLTSTAQIRFPSIRDMKARAKSFSWLPKRAPYSSLLSFLRSRWYVLSPLT
ncbi:hypothetical protein SISSUDRAFT_574604 [Sistotremastrum suecicum HHB10207 ss-3]|uniref:Uncharacterized protein n=1 Tax=Sistotremastrum suecicum HHB10207 ss-3 TaxID=1314776 RepID=A0A165XGI3_9AGAM|nr:hypothetical protein SISSUDRAFT_574604 [Sistotremastrum suecicum HHB10207 ss-3]